MTLGEDPRAEGDEALLVAIRSWLDQQGASLPELDEDALVNYVLGTARPEQAKAVRSALEKSGLLRGQVLELIEISEGDFTQEQRLAFVKAAAPSVDKAHGPAALARRLERGAPSSGAHVGRDPAVARRRWLGWLLGGWATVATAAASLLLVVSLKSESGKLPTRIGGTGPAEKGPREAPSGSVRGQGFALLGHQTVDLRGATRGSSAVPTPAVVLDPSTRVLVIQAEPPDVPDDSNVIVTLTAPTGSVLVHETRPVAEFYRGTGFFLEFPPASPPGTYHLAISGQRDGVPLRETYSFDVRGR